MVDAGPTVVHPLWCCGVETAELEPETRCLDPQPYDRALCSSTCQPCTTSLSRNAAVAKQTLYNRSAAGR